MEAAAAKTREEITRTLQYRLQDAVRSIGDPALLSSWVTFEQAEAYALGVKHTFQILVEDFELSSKIQVYDKIEAALGERFRRMHPGKRFFSSLKLDRLVARVRDHRIRMLDNYELLDYNGDYCSLRKDVERAERAIERSDDGAPSHWEDLNRLKNELHSLWCLNSELIGDKSWYAEHYRRRQEKEKQAA